MKRICLIFFLSASCLIISCKKTIEKIQEDLIIKAMTDGEWKITNFSFNNSIITADFANYKFKYYSNKTVDALNNGIVEQTGAWDGNAAAMTTSASFSSPGYPLQLINGNWLITNNSWTHVEAKQINGNDIKIMHLDKL